MKFEITWSIAQWIALAVQLMAVSVNIYAFYDCAICRATAEELEWFIKAMRGAKVDIMPPPQ